MNEKFVDFWRKLFYEGFWNCIPLVHGKLYLFFHFLSFLRFDYELFELIPKGSRKFP